MTPTILFIHGLESGPNGRKARTLKQAGFSVVSRQMPCGRAMVVRDRFVVGAAAGTAAAIAVSAVFGGVGGALAAAALATCAAPFAAARLMRRVFRRSIAVQVDALSMHDTDVVVGSSFGGAVALDLLRTGAWTGPTLLLCPAYALVARRAHLPLPPPLASLPESLTSRVLVVHGTRDTTVPIADSERLVSGSRANLVRVEDDHRLSATADASHFAAWIAAVRTAATEPSAS